MPSFTLRFLCAATVVLGFSGQAFAHAHLKSSVPADNSSVAAPSELDLTFSEELNIKFSGAKVTALDGKEVKLGDIMLMDGRKILMVPFAGTLAPGVYKVDWHVLSTDGHKTNGTYTFTVTP